MIQRSITRATLFLLLFFTWQAEAGSFANTGLINFPRDGHTATLLTNGNVLVTGGFLGNYIHSSAELYNPLTGTWTLTGSITNARCFHTASLLPNGKVLIAGGANNVSSIDSGYFFGACELYDPATQTWTATGALIHSRRSHTATLLPSGKVLVVGGIKETGGPTIIYSSAELYDPSTGTWTNTGSLNVARFLHTATLLPNGKVLVTGGNNSQPSPFGPALYSSELYDPATETWSMTTSNMNISRYWHTATLLTNGQVLVTGGVFTPPSGGGGVVSSAEIFNSDTGTWSNTASMNYSRVLHTAVSLSNGKVLVSGGVANGLVSSSAELYDPITGIWTMTGSMSNPRSGGHTATMLPSGKALVVGGDNGFIYIQVTELYDYIDPINLTGMAKLPSGAFRFNFTNTPGMSFSALATTNLSLPLTNWTTLGSVTEISSGQFQFTDTQATNKPQRFYRVQSN